MTPVLKPIAASFQTTNFVLDLCLGDLNDEDVKKRIRNGQGPSVAWQAGHMLAFRCIALGQLGVAKENPYAAQYLTTASDGRDYPQIPDYQREWKCVSSELETALASATPESLEQIVEDGAHGKRTVLESLEFLAWHEAYHTGALTAIRKELGYPSPAELTLAKASH